VFTAGQADSGLDEEDRGGGNSGGGNSDAEEAEEPASTGAEAVGAEAVGAEVAGAGGAGGEQASGTAASAVDRVREEIMEGGTKVPQIAARAIQGTNARGGGC
jgi:hypothetical protein